jgi:Amt family ammonium transporter
MIALLILANSSELYPVGLFVSIISAIIWYSLKLTIGMRVSEDDEYIGLDQSELGVPAYPEFVKS